jgi:hypothetical protein
MCLKVVDTRRTGQIAEPETVRKLSDFGGSVGYGEMSDFINNAPSAHAKKIQIS